VGFLIFIAILVAIALVIEYWQLVVAIVVLIVIFALIADASAKKKRREEAARQAKAAEEERKRQEREAAEAARRRAAEAARQKLQQDKDAISQNLHFLLGNPMPSSKDAMTYIRSVQAHLLTHAHAEGSKYEAHVYRMALACVGNADFSNALQHLELLIYLFPKNTIYPERKKVIAQIYTACCTPSCFIMDKGYGKAKADLLQRISVMTHEQCRQSMESNGLLYSLWFFAIKKPFDSVSYRNALQAVKTLQPEYFHVSTDAMLSAAYIANRQEREKLQEFYPDWQRDLMTYLQKASPEALLMMASTSSWSRDILTEAECLERLQQMNKLPDSLTSQYEYVKKMRGHMKKMGF